VPNVFHAQFAEAEYGYLAPIGNALAGVLADFQAEFTRAEGYEVAGDITVELSGTADLLGTQFRVSTSSRAATSARLTSPQGLLFPVPIGTTLLGSGPDANLRLDGVRIAPIQARIEYDGGSARLTNVAPAHRQITVNSSPVASADLHNYDLIRIGPHTLHYRDD
jgi:hypothetical protein